jgi:hypothetical protein
MNTPETQVLAQRPLLESLEPRLLLDGGSAIQLDYLIIAAESFCPVDSQHPTGIPCDSIQALADWKQLKGFNTKTVSMSYVQSFVESEEKGIKDYIRGGWDDEDQEYWDTPPMAVK